MMSRKVEAYVDGASRGNPGDSSYGAVIIEGDKVTRLAECLGSGTNNEAEYKGLLAVLEWAVDEGVKNLTVFSDSQLVVNQVLGRYKVKAKNLQPLFLRAHELTNRIPQFKFYYIAREFNTRADGLANWILDQKRPPGERLHETD